jgi:hypothetical protein
LLLWRRDPLHVGWYCCRNGSKEFPRVERIPHSFTDEDQQTEEERNDAQTSEPEPGGLEIRFALRQEFAERRRARGQTTTKNIE